MPTILTRSAGSARGYGFTGNPIYRIQKVLQSTTWTAPPGVTSILSLTGKGQDGAPAFWQSIFNLPFAPPGYIAPWVFADVPGEAGLNSADVEAFAQAQWDLFPNNPSAGTVNISWECRFYNTSAFTGSAVYGPYDIRATATKTKVGNGWGSVYPPETGTRPTYSINASNMEYYTPQFDGANTTGFGYTFAGGVGGPATPTTYTNVPVTPGTTYTINSAGDGYIIIVYYQGG